MDIPLHRKKCSEAEMTQYVENGIVRPFDLLNGEPLVRFEWIETENHRYFFVDFHHCIMDGSAITGFLLKDLADCYSGLSRPEPETGIYEAAEAEQQSFDTDSYCHAREYFQKELKGLSFVSLTENTDGKTGKTNQFFLDVDGDTVNRWTEQYNVKPLYLFLSAYALILSRMTHEKKIAFLSLHHGRSDSRFSTSYGMFVRNIPLTAESDDSLKVMDFIQSNRSKLHQTLANSDYPFTHLCRDLQMKPGITFNFMAKKISIPTLILDGKKYPCQYLKSKGHAGVMHVDVWGEDDHYLICLEGNSLSDKKETLQRIAEAMRTALLNMIAKPDSFLKEISITTEKETGGLLALGAGKKLDFDHAETLVDRFLKNAKRFPRSTAVSDAVSTLAYDELDRQSDVLAAELRKRGIRENDFVAVKLPRIKEFVLSVIGIWKAGGAYVPVDPEYPAERISYMLEDSGAKVVIDEEFFRKNDLSGQTSPVNFASPDSLAYMIYTSGSTGKPKGVMIPHISVRALTEWLLELTQADRHDVFAHYASFSFDASVIDFTTALAAGAAVCILDDATRKDMNALHHYFIEKHIAGVTLPTQFGMTLLNEFEDLPLRFLIMGGEKLQATKKHRTRIINGYGPTEFTVCSSYHIVDPEQDGDDIPIGRPVPNSISAIIDPSGNLLPRGMTGELVLLGTQIARGYFHRPELTAERFTDAPFLSGQKMYRTGDLARWDEKGELRYQGRIDNQVKLRGFRIEMGEIEAALAKYPGINDAVADVRMISGLPHLAAYYVSAAEIDEKALKSELAKSLAEYMVPELYLRLEKMPLTPNGKIDRKALPEPEPDSMPDTYAAPDTETEKIICRIFGDALKMKRFGAETDFFMAGGTSILGIRVVAELQRRKFNVVYGDIFKCRTPRTLAAFLTKPPEKQNEDANAVDYGDYDYSRIDAALQKTRSDLFTDFETHPLGDVLLTGATGYLGIHILKQLLDSTECRICLLIRAKKNMPPEKRLAAQYVYYFDDLFPEEYRKRLVFVNGDITDWDLHAKLSVFPYNTVINCAAIVKHYIADDKMDQANVQGVRNLIDCCIKDQARLIQISTYSVGGVVGSASNQMLDERHLYIGQTSDNDYVRTKFLAERCLLEEIASGRLKGKIMRLGNLMGRESDGEFQINTTSNAFVNSLKTFSILGAYPLMRLTEQVEMSPIDRVAEAVLKLSSTPDDMLVFQPYNTYHMDMGAILKALGKNGHKIEYISDSDFAARVDALRNDPARVKFLQGILHYGGHILANRTMTRPVNTWTTTVLYRLGFHWNQPDDRYLDKFLQILEGMRVFQQ